MCGLEKLHQTFVHCAISSTAENVIRSMTLYLSLWLINLSIQLKIFGLVSLYLTNYHNLYKAKLVLRYVPYFYSPLRPILYIFIIPNLHVLDFPIAFNLSQNQTLLFFCNLFYPSFFNL